MEIVKLIGVLIVIAGFILKLDTLGNSSAMRLSSIKKVYR